MNNNQQRNLRYNEEVTNTIEEDITSLKDYEEEDNNLYMNKKELILLENDHSLAIDYDYDDDHTISNKQNTFFRETPKQTQLKSPNNQTQRRQQNEIMKYIPDNIENYERYQPSSNHNINIKKNDEENMNRNPFNNSNKMSILSNIMQPIDAKIQDNYFIEEGVMSNKNQNKKLCIDSFQCCYLSNINMKNSMGSFRCPSFGITQMNQSEKEYIELKNNYNKVLDLLDYWQHFYFDIIKLVKPQSIKENDNINNFLSEQFKFSIIKEVKNLISNARNKIYKIFQTSKENNFIIFGNKKVNEIKLLLKSNEINNFTLNAKQNIKSILIEKKFEISKMKKILENNIFIDKDNSVQIKNEKSKGNKQFSTRDEIDSLPPIRYKEKISEGINTDIIGDISNDIDKDIAKEKEDMLKKESQIQTIDIPIIKPIKSKFDEDKIKRETNVIIVTFIGKNIKLQKSHSMIKKLSNNEIQTDFTMKNIESIEILNKEWSSQLKITKKEKEKMKKQYEDKISELNEQIEETKKKNDNSNKDNNAVDPISLFLPEMIPPEQTYKIFMHCVKHFKYEEEIYKKNMEEADLNCLKSFVNKMEKYIFNTSVPFQKNPPKRPPHLIDKYKESILTGIRPLRNYNSENYNTFSYPERRNNSTYKKYKAAIQNIKNQ